MDVEKIKDDILLATLPNVVFDGWTHQALRDGTVSAGYDVSMAVRTFPNGIPDVVEHFSAWADRRMEEEMRARDLSQTRVTDRITLAVRTRLEVLEPHQEAVRRALTYLSLPQNAAMALRLLSRTVDAMWYAAGDTATDFSYYTKRAILSGVVSSTTLYWLNDSSEGHQDTWGFLDRRLADVGAFGRTMGKVRGAGGLLNLLPSPTRFARQIRRRATD
ncbi:MAG TPA: COQ9 family protein [Azospirillaceae bacterium]|nr:COQ9 family protein [Azospirillaceae bacterium]